MRVNCGIYEDLFMAWVWVGLDLGGTKKKGARDMGNSWELTVINSELMGTWTMGTEGNTVQLLRTNHKND